MCPGRGLAGMDAIRIGGGEPMKGSRLKSGVPFRERIGPRSTRVEDRRADTDVNGVDKSILSILFPPGSAMPD